MGKNPTDRPEDQPFIEDLVPVPEGLEPEAFRFYARLRRLEEFVSANRHRRITRAEIARRLHIAPSHFSSYFHLRTGTRYTQWIAFVKIRTAVELMSRHDLTVGEVGRAVGYEDRSTFLRAFKRVTGLTPSATQRVLRPTADTPSVPSTAA